MVRIPQVVDIETAIEIYYSRIELKNADIIRLFGKLGSAKVCALKELARKKTTENKTPIWDAKAVNTKNAYDAWGLDIDDLERRDAKLKKLGRG